ncbi:carbon-nitrogen hydrolase [Xylariales sp. PMI_506]|nr:carbon-nitrogen hydrolase [Xylariales sp. PMI_506]
MRVVGYQDHTRQVAHGSIDRVVMAKSPRVGIVQLHIPEGCTPAEQYARAAEFIKTAARDGADVAILPEMAFGIHQGTEQEKDEFAAENYKCIEKLQELAKDLSINIIPGSSLEAERDESGKVLHYYNTTYYIDRLGDIKLRYRKVNLWGSEKLAVSPGSEHIVIDTEEFGKLGLLICWDLAFPEAFRALVRAGARYIFIPTLWRSPDCGEKGLAYNKESEYLFINSTIAARAFEQNACVVFCNTGGPNREEFFGCSQITLPFKGPIVKLDGAEQVTVTEVDLGSILEDAEEVWNIREELASPNWYPVKA